MKTTLNRKNVFSIYSDAPPTVQKGEPVVQARIVEKVTEQIERKQDQIIVNPTPVIVNFPESKPQAKPKKNKPKIFPIEPIGVLKLEKTKRETVKQIHVPIPKKAPKPKSTYRATGMDILDMGDNLKKLRTWEDFSAFLSKLSSKNLTLMAKGKVGSLDNFNFDGKWLMFTVSGIKSKQVIPGLWKTATVGRIR
jgi:hypothetical protein